MKARNLRSRLAVIDRRLNADDSPEEFLVLVDPDEIRADHARLPTVSSAADALGLLAMMGHELAPEVRARHAVTPLKRIVATWGRIIELGESPPITSLAQAHGELRDQGFCVEVDSQS